MGLAWQTPPLQSNSLVESCLPCISLAATGNFVMLVQDDALEVEKGGRVLSVCTDLGGAELDSS